jgi:hypothetical protein
MVAAPSLDKDIPSPLPMCRGGGGGKVEEGRSVAICTPHPLLVGVSMVVVREPIETHALLSRSQKPVTKSSSA